MKNKKSEQPEKAPLLKFFENQQYPIAVRPHKENVKNKSMYRLMIQNYPQPILIYDNQTLQILEVNRAAILKYGYLEKEFLTLTIKDISPFGEVPGLFQQIDNVSQTYDSKGVWKHRKKNGEVFFVEIAANSIDFKSRKAGYMIVSDNSARLSSESRLRKDAERSSWLLELYNHSSTLSDNDLYYRVLDIIVKITNSRIGFYHEMSEDQTEVVFSTSNLDGLIDFSIFRGNPCPINETGRWACCASTLHPMIDNFYSNENDQLSLKTGERTLLKLLSVPFIWDNKVLFILAVGNKNFDYDTSDVDQIQTIANELFKILEKRKVESTLRKSEEKFRNIFENVQDVYFESSLDGIILEISPSVEIVTNGFYTRNDLIGKSIIGFCSIPDQPKFFYSTLVNLGKVSDYELFLLTNVGSLVIVSISASVKYNSFGRVEKVIGSMRNNSDRKKAELALQQTEKSYWSFFECFSQGVVCQDYKGIIISVNPSALKILGSRAEQMIGHSSDDLNFKAIHEDGSLFSAESFPAKVALCTGKKANAVMGVYNDSQSKFNWIKLIAVPEFRPGEDFPYQVFTTLEDITLLKETLEELNISNRNLEVRVEQRTRESIQLSKLQRAILNNAGLAIISISTDGIIRLFNNAAEQMLGYSANEVIGKLSPEKFHCQNELIKHAKELKLLTGEDTDDESVIFLSIVKESVSSTREWTYIRKDGSRFPIRLTVSAIEDEFGEVIGYIGIAMDLTKEKLANQSKRESEERFHNMFHNHAAVMLLVNPVSGKIVDANLAAKTFYGYEFNETDNINISVINILSREQIQIEMQNALEQNRNYFQFKHRLSTGKIRIVEVHSTPIDVMGEKLLFSIIHDITERWLVEEALKNSEKHLNQITDSVPVFISLANNDLEYIFVNSAYQDFFNLKKSEIIGKKVEDLLSAESYSVARPYLKMALEGHTCKFENEIRNHEGKKKTIHTTYLPYYQDNLIVGVLATVVDITDQVKADLLLRNSEAENRAILQAVPDLLFRLDRNGIFLTSFTGNPDALYAKAEYFLGKKIEEVLPEEVAKMAINFLAESFETHETVTFEYELCVKNQVRYFEDRILAISDNEALSIIRDITDRKLAEIGLQSTMKKLTILLQNLRSGTLFEDETRHITLVNQSFCDLFEIIATPGELVGLDSTVAFGAIKHLMIDPDGYVNRISEILANCEITVNDELFLQDGRVFERDYVPISHNNTLLGHLWNYRDITDRKKLEDSLLATVAREKELNDLKSRFVSMASHEFRTPLATILITDEALLAYWKRMDQDQIDSRLQIIKDQVVHLTNVVTDVMQIAKIQEGKISIDLKEIDLLSFCKETISNFNISSPVNNGIQFNSVFKELRILLDNRIMVQVLNNLISNAIKYSVENPTVAVELLEGENEIILGVTDHGIGISVDDQKYIFQPFYRASNVEKIPGNGLGLNIIRESVRLFGGEITFESILGIGTTFFVNLPKTLVVSKKA